MIEYKRTIENEEIKQLLDKYKINKFEKVFFLENIKDFRNIIFKYRNKNYVFRGISHPIQKYSTITREIYNGNKSSLSNRTYNILFSKELNYIRKFEENAEYLTGSFNNPCDLVAAAQHYGVFTRFIDWTRSMLIATIFATYRRNKDGYYIVLIANQSKSIVVKELRMDEKQNKCGVSLKLNNQYGLKIKYLTQMFLDKGNKEKLKKYFEIVYLQDNFKYCVTNIHSEDEICGSGNVNALIEKFQNDKLFFIETNFSNNRLCSQNGLFQIAISPYKTYIDNAYSDLDILIIPSHLRKEIIIFCEKMGINSYGIMSDAQNIANVINEKAKEKIRSKI